MARQIFTYLIILFVLFVISTCEKDTNFLISNNTNNTIDSPILFVRYYTNYAWGFSYSGWYVDIEGQIYETDENSYLRLECLKHDSIISAEMMVELLQSSDKTTRKLSQPILSEMKRLIIPASLGHLTEPVSGCRDFGTICYFTFIRDQDNNSYRSILLYQAGDWSQKNLSQEAKELFELLREHVENDTTQLPCSQ